MKRSLCMLLCLVLLLPLWGCGRKSEILPESSVTEATTEPEITEPAPTEPEVTEPAETIPEHSALYLENVPVEDVILWFNEVTLDTEFSDGGDATLVQKWGSPILYYVYGEPTDADLAVLESFGNWLNTLEGFPGFLPADFEMQANLHIHFTDAQGLLEKMGRDYGDVDGAVTFWYDVNNVIFDEIICIRTDLAQEVRNSVIMEEIYNGLGPVQDTALREDSLIWQGYSIPQELTAVDELILKLLYHPDIQCGMDARQCEEVIRMLYD